MRNLLLAIDIGNSALSYAVFQKNRIVRSGHFKSDNIPKIDKLLSKSGVNKSFKVIICSVVPHLTLKLRGMLRQKWGILPIIVAKTTVPTLKMKYQRSILGSDRLVNLYGAIHLYKAPLLVLDFGTAITFDYVSKSNVFEGGLIIPGVETAWNALMQKAALLPKKLEIKPFKKLIGKNTKEAMLAGVLQGYGALSDGMIERFKSQYGSKMTVIATGGHAHFISSYSKRIDYVDPYHTLRSLSLIYSHQTKHQQ